jgi:antitoxin (DNA-binding transcriptional repressor) of toxin-antitoxin stability system
LAVLLVALVAEDATSLRSAPSDSAPAQATLYRGDWLEVRGEVPGFLKVWDHRHERPGYLRPARVRVHRAEAAAAGELATVVRFLRDGPGFESLGIGYAALYLKVAAVDQRAQPAWGEVLGALGVMAERLATRASGSEAGRSGRERDAVLAGHLGVIESYGVRLRRFEQGERAVLCYDGDACARVVALATAAAEERARAALALTRRACFDPVTLAPERRVWNEARLTVLHEVDPASSAFMRLPRPLAHRLRLRMAEALAERAHARAGGAGGAGGDADMGTAAASEALRLLALVDRGELAPEDQSAYDETAVRVGAVRWLTEAPEGGARALRVEVAAGRPGERCVRVVRTFAASRSGAVSAALPAPLAERCTFGVVFASSVRVAVAGNAVAIAVAPVASWTELWLFRSGGSGGATDWRIDVLPPALGQPGDDIGYVELAGFSPDGLRVLVAREFRIAGKCGRRFELLAADTTVTAWAATPTRLRAFERWASVTWRRTTLALR